MAKDLALGVFTGIGNSPEEALARVAELGFPTCQLSYPAGFDTDEGVAAIKEACAKHNVEITTIFCGFSGESYADIPTVQKTVGLVPQSTRAERVVKIDVISKFAQKLGVDRVGAHIGFVPEDHSVPLYAEMVETVQGICDQLQGRNQVFALETGQETANGLRQFINDLKRDNIRVNFDPANMILYGNDDPIAALEVLAPWIDGVHCKDGNWPTEENQLGHETPLGEGAVNFPKWIATLLGQGFTGPLTIEREISGEKQKLDLIAGREMLQGLLDKNRS